jgi:hypothetical protein
LFSAGQFFDFLNGLMNGFREKALRETSKEDSFQRLAENDDGGPEDYAPLSTDTTVPPDHWHI